jgi:hypothetical protein
MVVGHGSKFGRKKEEAIAALLTQKNIEEAARAANIGTKTLLRWLFAARPFRNAPLASISPPRSVPVRSMVAGLEPSVSLRISISIVRSPDLAMWPSRNMLTFFSRPMVHWLKILLPVMVPLAW